MLHVDPSRRLFLQLSGALGAGTLLGAGLAGCEGPGPSPAGTAGGTGEGGALTPEEVRTLEALSDTILPGEGDAPGAVAMGAVAFMERFLPERPELLARTRASVERLEARARESHPEEATFADLDDGARAAVVGRFTAEEGPAFGLLWVLVMEGLFSDPSYGGNRDKAGWGLLGFDDRHAWQPPFGVYDAQATDVPSGGDEGRDA